MEVTVCIPTLNGGARFAALARRIGELNPPPAQVLVTDSASEDATVEVARTAGFAVEVIPRGEFNHGLTRNRMLERVQTPLAAMLVQDALPLQTDYLQQLTAPFADERVAGVYARQVAQPNANPLIRARLESWMAAREEPVVQEIEDAEAFADLPPRERMARAVFDNVASCVRVAAMREIPFRERKFGEDIDWSWRALHAGWKIAYQPLACVEHSHDNGIMYEMRRVYLDHQNLRRLFGINVFPRFREVPWAAWNSWRAWHRQLPGMGYQGMERIRWSAYGGAYYLTQNVAQFLGANLSKHVDEGRFQAIDNWMSRGV